MSSIYKSKSKEDIKGIWNLYIKGFSKRSIGTRITPSKTKGQITEEVIVEIDNDAIALIKELQKRLVKNNDDKNQSQGVISAKNNNYIDYCKKVLDYTNPKGKDPCMFIIESDFDKNQSDQNKLENFQKLKEKKFKVLKFGEANIINYYLNCQEKKSILTDVIEEYYKEYIEKNNRTITPIDRETLLAQAVEKDGLDLLDKTLHFLILYKKTESAVTSRDTVHDNLS